MIFYVVKRLAQLQSGSYYRHESLVVAAFFEFNHTISQSENGKVFTNANILARMINSTTLTNDDVASNGRLTTVDLYTKALALRIAAVLYRTFTFFMCHNSKRIFAG